MASTSYLRLAETIVAEIEAGALKPGDRLPPQREFAFERKIAVSTASRVYAELLRRGLVVGEIGRGTFISGRLPERSSVRPEHAEARYDLEFNFPILSDQTRYIAASLAPLGRPEVLANALKPASSWGTSRAREISAQHLARGGWQPKPESLFFTGNGRQAVAAAIGALVPIGGRLGVEAITYPVVKGIASRLGITLIPLPLDRDGIRPDALLEAHKNAPLSALYFQPSLQNPLGVTLSPARRADLVKLLEKLGLVAIEDAVYSFLCDDPPLAAQCPERCVVVDSLSKRIAPGLGLGFISAPDWLRERVMTSVRSGGWVASGYALEAGQLLMSDGTARMIEGRKRTDAQERQHIAAECLAGFKLQADDRAYHLWLTLPEHWRSESFVNAAARHGIALTPSSTFTVDQGYAPNAVRLALASPSIERLREALKTLASTLRYGMEAFDVTE
jgi:DNA-binding transcriptional MocR family regulator